jgi:hypothetical protein
VQLVAAKALSLGHMIDAAGGQGGGADIEELQSAHAAHEVSSRWVLGPGSASFLLDSTLELAT